MGEKGKKEERRMSRVERFILYTGRPDTGDIGGGQRSEERRRRWEIWDVCSTRFGRGARGQGVPGASLADPSVQGFPVSQITGYFKIGQINRLLPPERVRSGAFPPR